MAADSNDNFFLPIDGKFILTENCPPNAASFIFSHKRSTGEAIDLWRLFLNALHVLGPDSLAKIYNANKEEMESLRQGIGLAAELTSALSGELGKNPYGLVLQDESKKEEEKNKKEETASEPHAQKENTSFENEQLSVFTPPSASKPINSPANQPIEPAPLVSADAVESFMKEEEDDTEGEDEILDIASDGEAFIADDFYTEEVYNSDPSDFFPAEEERSSPAAQLVEVASPASQTAQEKVSKGEEEGYEEDGYDGEEDFFSDDDNSAFLDDDFLPGKNIDEEVIR